jgi:hypothetical protein
VHGIADGNVTALTFLTTFIIGQYYSFILTRWHARFACINDATGDGTRVTYYTACWIGRHDKAVAARLMRLNNLTMHLYHLMSFGPLDEGRWGVLLHRGLVTTPEMNKLRKLRKPGTEACLWCQTIVDDMRRAGVISEWQATQLNTYIGSVRGLSAYQVSYAQTGVPFCFYHMLTMLILLLLLVRRLRWRPGFCEVDNEDL